MNDNQWLWLKEAVEVLLLRTEVIELKANKIMATEQQLLDQMKLIDAATTKQAEALQADGDALQKISDDLDKIIAAGPQAGVSQGTLDQLTALATRAQAVSDNLDTHSAFSKTIAVKADNAVPQPVPPPVPLAP